MITVNIHKDDYKGKIQVTGHAGTKGKDGGDVVCAAASMAMTLLCQNLEDDTLFSYRRYRLEKGDSFATYHVSGDMKDVSNRVVDGVLVAFKLLETTYPQCVKIINE